MNPSPDQCEKIRAFVAALPGGWATPHAGIRAAMAASLVANPVTSAPTIPVPFAAVDLANACSAPNRPNLGGYLAAAAPLVIAGDAAHIGQGLDALVPIGAISADDAAAMKAATARTQPDPAWAPEVAWDIGTLGRPCDDFDIEASRPQGD